MHRFGVLGKKLPVAEYTERQTRQLLSRYGVVTYASLADEEGAWEWSLINRHLQRMEMRGEVRRGYFVKDLPGVQYALPDVVEQLRNLRDQTGDDQRVIVMNAADPANLYGPQREDNPNDGGWTIPELLPGWHRPILSSTGVFLSLVAENLGNTLTTLQGADAGSSSRQALKRSLPT